jgi:hypothetical protein
MLKKKELIFSTYLSSRAKNVRFITRAAPPLKMGHSVCS